MGELLETYRGYVSVGECDEMGHMNIQHYVGKTSEAAFNFRVALGMSRRYQRASNRTYVALRHHIRFHRELLASDIVHMTSGILELREKTMQTYQELRNSLTGELAATFLGFVGHMDQDEGRLVPWPEITRERAKAYLVDLPEVGRARSIGEEPADPDIDPERAAAAGYFVTNRTAVNAWECDTNRHMNARFFFDRFSQSQGHMWAAAGLDRQSQKRHGLITATVEIRCDYFSELLAGETILVMTRIEPLGEKTLRYRHLVFEGDSGRLAAIGTGTGLMMDRETRRAVTLPEEVRTRLAGAER